MNRNSTIKQKIGKCEVCVAKGDHKKKPLIADKCQYHYQIYRAKISQERAENRASTKGKNKSIEEESIAILKKEVDDLFSRWVRLSASDDNGYCSCFICGYTDRYQDMDAGHYIKRGNSFLRYDPRNVKPNCKICNQAKDGNYVEYTRRMEEENPGITDILIEESELVYRYGRSELKQMVSEYSQKVFKLISKIH